MNATHNNGDGNYEAEADIARTGASIIDSTELSDSRLTSTFNSQMYNLNYRVTGDKLTVDADYGRVNTDNWQDSHICFGLYPSQRWTISKGLFCDLYKSATCLFHSVVLESQRADGLDKTTSMGDLSIRWFLVYERTNRKDLFWKATEFELILQRHIQFDEVQRKNQFRKH